MTIIYHQPSIHSVFAQKVIYEGFLNAANYLGYKFVTYTAGMDLEKVLEENSADIFITASHFFWRKQLDYNILKKYRDKGLKVWTKIDFWTSPMATGRVNEAKSMKDDEVLKKLIKDNLLGDYYFHVVEQKDPRMEGWREFSGVDYITIPLAADRKTDFEDYDKNYKFDIAFIGAYQPQKKKFFQEYVFPLKAKYDLQLIGRDWTWIDKQKNNIHRVGQYFNIPILKTLQKPVPAKGETAKIYTSSKLLINVHEEYQRSFGGDCNDRTFKVPACGGLIINDDVSCIRKYFADDEIVIAKDKNDWFEKIDYYMSHTEEAKKIAKKAQIRVMTEHLWEHRLQKIINTTKNNK